ncbi:aldo/keto reductase [Halalkalibacter sp. AB-rgal2]|uniref:aldo/keto reductase n=1 Tax=Halalkalibacter sp. AB-rgal2 TaxID=3242695 RepID=UPI00359F0974
MKYKQLGSTDLKISELSFGTWAIGGAWGQSDDQEAIQGLHRAIDLGVNFFDTADVYGDGHSEELIAKATKGKENDIYIATKFCRSGDIHDINTYSPEQVRAYCEASLKRLERERIDLFQVHCPPFEIIKEGSVFQVLDELQQEGKIRYYGVSVETVEEGLYCMENYSNVRALQVIFNVLRQKPLEQLLPKAIEKQIGILARVPLASGLLTGKFSKDSSFSSDDHRHFNRDGTAFNVGETFSGLPFEKGVELSEKVNWMKEGRGSLTQAALRWILDQEGITCAIPGFKTVKQIEDNLKAINVSPFTKQEIEKLSSFYKEEVHQHIRGVY